MKKNLHHLIAVLVITGLVLSACGGGNQTAHLRFNSPANGAVFQVNASVYIDIGVDNPNAHFNSYQLVDNGYIFYPPGGQVGSPPPGIGLAPLTEAGLPWSFSTPGYHRVTAQAWSDQANGYSETSICIVVTDATHPNQNLPIGADGSCPVVGAPQHLEAATVTPVTTPLIIIRPDNNNGNNNGGNGNPGGATGCAAYGDKTSCDLAGCSWNGSACTVSP